MRCGGEKGSVAEDEALSEGRLHPEGSQEALQGSEQDRVPSGLLLSLRGPRWG